MSVRITVESREPVPLHQSLLRHSGFVMFKEHCLTEDG